LAFGLHEARAMKLVAALSFALFFSGCGDEHEGVSAAIVDRDFEDQAYPIEMTLRISGIRVTYNPVIFEHDDQDLRLARASAVLEPNGVCTLAGELVCGDDLRCRAPLSINTDGVCKGQLRASDRDEQTYEGCFAEVFRTRSTDRGPWINNDYGCAAGDETCEAFHEEARAYCP
jgi:hypothetical protein